MPVLPHIITMGIGVVICVLAILNMTGNISSIHEYHRHRVTQENVKSFGRLVGIGTLIVGLSVICFDVLLIAFDITKANFLIPLGLVVLFGGLALGIAISFFAMIKYNKGIF